MNLTTGLQTSDTFTTAPSTTSTPPSPSPEASTSYASTTVITSAASPSTTSFWTTAKVTDPFTAESLSTTASPVKGGLHPGAIAGIALAGVLAAVLLLCLAACCFCKRLRRNSNGAILMKNLSFTKFRKKFNQQKQQKQKEVQDKRTLEEPEDLTYIENSESREVYQNMPHDKKKGRKEKPKDYNTCHDDTYVNVSKVTEATPAAQDILKQTLHQEPSTEEEVNEYYNVKHKKQPLEKVSDYYNLKQDKQHHQLQSTQGDCSPTDEVNDYYNVKKKPLRNKSEAAYLTILPPEGATKLNPEPTIYDPVGNEAQAPPSPQDGIYQNV